MRYDTASSMDGGVCRISMGFGNAIEGEKSAQRLIELSWWGSAVAGGTIEDHLKGTLKCARTKSVGDIEDNMMDTKVLIPIWRLRPLGMCPSQNFFYFHPTRL